MRQFFKDASTATVVAIVASVLAVVVFITVGLVGVYGEGWFTDHTANRQGETQKKHLVEGNGQYRIAAYDHFFDLCTQVQSSEASIQNAEAELKTTTDQQRQTVLNASITALRNSRAQLIFQYNNDSEKSYTEGQFKSSQLPYRLDTTQENTQCTV